MHILLTGATGFIGQTLARELFKDGHHLTIASRRANALAAGDWGMPTEFLQWDPATEPFPDSISIDTFDVVIHLLGESVADGAWTPEKKRRIYDSRIASTQHLGAAIAQRKTPLPCFIMASAIGFYPFDEPRSYDESAAPGSHFLATVCRDWEAAGAAIKPVDRTVYLRIGVVLGADGGALDAMRPAFETGAGGPLGAGQQLMSWIHRDDLVRIIQTALKDERYRGAINCVAPQPVSNKDFSRALGRALGRPAAIPVPASLLRLALGEKATLVLGSQAILPQKLSSLGFKYQYPELDQALAEACNHTVQYPMACRRYSAVQFVPRPLPEVFAFFCDPYNLEKITPPLLSFKIKSISTTAVEQGTLIEYRLKVHGVPMHWRTRIEDWRVNEAFVDIQEAGPYRVWHHTHRFTAVPGGTLMEDLVRFKVPFGPLGDLFGLPLVRRDVREIFRYRRQVIEKSFKA